MLMSGMGVSGALGIHVEASSAELTEPDDAIAMGTMDLEEQRCVGSVARQEPQEGSLTPLRSSYDVSSSREVEAVAEAEAEAG